MNKKVPFTATSGPERKILVWASHSDLTVHEGDRVDSTMLRPPNFSLFKYPLGLGRPRDGVGS